MGLCLIFPLLCLFQLPEAKPRVAVPRNLVPLVLRVANEDNSPQAGVAVRAWDVLPDTHSLEYSWNEANAGGMWSAFFDATDLSMSQPQHEALTDESGLVTFMCVRPRAAHIVRAQRADASSGVLAVDASVSAPSESIDLSESPSTPPITITLHPMAHLRGRVTGQGRVAVPGATVSVAVAPRKPWRPQKPAEVPAETSGSFDVLVDTPFVGAIRARADDATSPIRYLSATPGQVVDVALSFAAEFYLDGTVAIPETAGDFESERCNVEVSFIPQDTHVPVSIEADVGRDGTFEVALPSAGEYTIDVTYEGLLQGKRCTGQVLVPGLDPEVIIELRWPGVILGRVVGPPGEDLSGVMEAEIVRDAIHGDNDGREASSAALSCFGVIASDGTFSITGVCPGYEYQLNGGRGGKIVKNLARVVASLRTEVVLEIGQ